MARVPTAGGGGVEGAVLHMVHDSQFTENNSSLIRLSDLKSNLEVNTVIILKVTVITSVITLVVITVPTLCVIRTCDLT